MCRIRPPHVSVSTIFEILRYMYRRNTIFIRFLKILRQSPTGFPLHGAHRVGAFPWKHHKREIQLDSRKHVVMIWKLVVDQVWLLICSPSLAVDLQTLRHHTSRHPVAPPQSLVATSPRGITRAGMLTGWSSPDKGSRETEVRLEPLTFYSPFYAEKPRSTVQPFHPYWESPTVRISRNSDESRTRDLLARISWLFPQVASKLRNQPRLQIRYPSWRARKKYPLNCALMMSPRMVAKRLQANCQARRTDRQPPDQQPIGIQVYMHMSWRASIPLPLNYRGSTPTNEPPQSLRQVTFNTQSNAYLVNSCLGPLEFWHKCFLPYLNGITGSLSCPFRWCSREKSFSCSTLLVPSFHATRRGHEDWDTHRLPKPIQRKSRGRGRVRTMNLPHSSLSTQADVNKRRPIWHERANGSLNTDSYYVLYIPERKYHDEFCNYPRSVVPITNFITRNPNLICGQLNDETERLQESRLQKVHSRRMNFNRTSLPSREIHSFENQSGFHEILNWSSRL
ncbi:hypothetical protein T265_08492 [Opisthorchis viverrini]|uniref:Uncharacterized protein n=1 Tax=Opisthorchis viverrini TaxID=6198 RepID=A0A074ZK19_OPIVI|nr:hypothetical protein T265_08492 [Opisthorchis viverrini]KER23685.1 hypothetical protein T265_08492 [Opisthorchis viverrini]